MEISGGRPPPGTCSEVGPGARVTPPDVDARTGGVSLRGRVRHGAHATATPAGSALPRRERKTMYPGMMHWLRNARRHGACGSHAGQGASGEGFSFHRGDGDDLGGGGAFCVRRPLRVLAYRLNLNETQVEELAKILDELKTERAQAAVDDRRLAPGFAHPPGLDPFDALK